MGFQTLSHANAHALQQSIFADLMGKPNARAEGNAEPPKIEARAKCELIRTWMELEVLKRELRGIPRLKAADVDSMLKKARRTIQKELAEPIEVQEIDTAPAPAGE